MSIQPVRVLGRIVDEVACGRRLALPCESFTHSDFRTASAGEVLEVVRSAEPRDARLASLLHFWTYGLRAFLERLGSLDQLSGAAGYGMCETISDAQWWAGLASLERSLGDPARVRVLWPAVSRCREAYLMIDGSCRRSAVAATEGGDWLAYYWAHGFARDRSAVPVWSKSRA